MGNLLVTENRFRNLQQERQEEQFRLLQQSLQSLQQSQQSLEERLQQQAQQQEEQLRLLKQTLQNEKRYENGTYYKNLNDIWEPRSCFDFDEAASKWASLRQKDEEAIRYYTDPEQQGRVELRYYKDKFVDRRLFPPKSQSMAHLIPKDTSCSLAWLRPLSIITGLGICPDSKHPIYDDRLRTLVEGRSPKIGGCATVPLKAQNWNYLMLPDNHSNHFDYFTRKNEKHMIACPVWDPNNEWKPGMGYELVIAASAETYKWLLGIEMLTGKNKEYFKWIREVDSLAELQVATDFLALTVKALADLLVKHGDNDLEIAGNLEPDENKSDTSLERVFKGIQGAIPETNLSDRSSSTGSSVSSNRKGRERHHKQIANVFHQKITKVNHVRENFLVDKENRNGCVQIPKLIEDFDNEKPVLVVNLGAYFEGREGLIPDPFLVVLKAAVSWSGYCDQKLLPACGSHSEEFESVESIEKEDWIPEEIFTFVGEGASADCDEDSVLSVSEKLTGSPGDGHFKAKSIESPSGKASVQVVTP